MSLRGRSEYLGILLGALLLGACALPTQEKPPMRVAPLQLSPGEELGVDRVLIVTDSSSSMYRHPEAQARALTLAVISGLPDDPSGQLEAGAIAFGGSERVTVPLASLDRERLLNYARALKPLGGLSDRRGTLFGGGGITPLDEIFAEISKELQGRSGRTAVVLISDGEPTSPERARHAAEQLIAGGAGGQICLFTVRVEGNPKGDTFSRELSELSGCGRSLSATQLRTAGAVDNYTRSVLATVLTPLPPVAAPPPCESRLQLSDIEFDFDQATLRPGSRSTLTEIGTQLRGCRDVSIEVSGYADSTGAAAYNQTLSERRAESVRRALIDAGVDPARLSTRGYGSTHPIAPNDTRAGRAKNRRVEFQPTE